MGERPEKPAGNPPSHHHCLPPCYHEEPVNMCCRPPRVNVNVSVCRRCRWASMRIVKQSCMDTAARTAALQLLSYPRSGPHHFLTTDWVDIDACIYCWSDGWSPVALTDLYCVALSLARGFVNGCRSFPDGLQRLQRRRKPERSQHPNVPSHPVRHGSNGYGFSHRRRHGSRGRSVDRSLPPCGTRGRRSHGGEIHLDRGRERVEHDYGEDPDRAEVGGQESDDSSREPRSLTLVFKQLQ